MVSDGLEWVPGQSDPQCRALPPTTGWQSLYWLLLVYYRYSDCHHLFFFEKRVPFSRQKLVCIDTRNFAEAYDCDEFCDQH